MCSSDLFGGLGSGLLMLLGLRLDFGTFEQELAHGHGQSFIFGLNNSFFDRLGLGGARGALLDDVGDQLGHTHVGLDLQFALKVFSLLDLLLALSKAVSRGDVVILILPTD